jgi:hypothetical protein
MVLVDDHERARLFEEILLPQQARLSLDEATKLIKAGSILKADSNPQ